PTHERSVWTQPAWRIEATDHPDYRALLRFADKHIPHDAHLAVAPNVWPGAHGGGTLPTFAFFTWDLRPTVLFDASPPRARLLGAGLAILPSRRARPDPGWTRVLRAGRWGVFRRAGTSS